jgi:hypothetical protein
MAVKGYPSGWPFCFAVTVHGLADAVYVIG